MWLTSLVFRHAFLWYECCGECPSSIRQIELRVPIVWYPGRGRGCSASKRQIELRMTTLWSREMFSIKTANRATDDYPLVSGNAQHQNGESSYGCILYCLVSGDAEHENDKSSRRCTLVCDLA